MPDTVKGAEKFTPKPEMAKIEIKPKLPEPTAPKKGRPKKPAPLTWADFEKDALCKEMDQFVKNMINQSMLRNRSKQLENTKVGSALMYSVYYYTKFQPSHPLMVLAIAFLATGSNVMSCLKSPKVPKVEEKPKEEVKK